MSQYAAFHQDRPIGQQTNEQVAATKHLVQQDPHRFNKWRARIGKEKFRSFRRTLPDGDFAGFGKRDGTYG